MSKAVWVVDHGVEVAGWAKRTRGMAVSNGGNHSWRGADKKVAGGSRQCWHCQLFKFKPRPTRIWFQSTFPEHLEMSSGGSEALEVKGILMQAPIFDRHLELARRDSTARPWQGGAGIDYRQCAAAKTADLSANTTLSVPLT